MRRRLSWAAETATLTQNSGSFDLRATVHRWANSPLDFVLEAMFRVPREAWRPWQPGSPRPAVPHVGPELWQGRFLDDVADAKVNGRRRFSVRAGHGVGKSTVEAWLILWFTLFHRNLKVPVTANSQDQLRDVVWAEIARWHRELPPFIRDMIEITAERVVVKADPEAAFAVARTARPEKPEALQGFHAETLSFALAAEMPRPDAQAVVKTLCREAGVSGTPLRALVGRDFPQLDVEALFDPVAQLGAAPTEALRFSKKVAELAAS